MSKVEKNILIVLCSILFVICLIGLFFAVKANIEMTYVVKDNSYVMKEDSKNSNYFYNCLSAKQKSLYRSFHKEINLFINGEKELEMEGEYYILGRFLYRDFDITQEAACQALAAFCYDSPSYYMIVSSHCLSYSRMICPIVEKEYISKETRDILEQRINGELDKLSIQINELENDYDKLKYIYDYILDNTGYSKITNIECNNIISVFDNDVNTLSHCQGYANSLSLLCNYFDIECLFVGSNAANHSFNVVKMEGVWYYCDATIDDKNERDYKYFLCGETEYWERFDSTVPLYNTPESEGISWQGQLPNLSLVSYNKNIE